MRRLNRIQCDAKNTLGSSSPVPIVHDTQSIIQPSTPVISIPEEGNNMEDERGGDYINLTPSQNPRRKVTRDVNCTSKNYALIGLNSEEADKLWEMDTRFLTTVGVEGEGFGTSSVD